jgi:ABC-2 type transport system ATP-binding protein
VGLQDSNQSHALDVSGLRVTYGPKVAVDDVSFSIDEGEIFGLLGPNGAGKTSTLSAIEGLVKPASGSIRVDGIDPLVHAAEARARIGVQLQATSFQRELTIRELVRLYSGLYGASRSKSAADEHLAAVHLTEEAGKRFGELSGGQQKRLALLIATVHEPSLCLLDEPTAGLDPQSRRQLWERIEQMRRGGRSILLTTHSMEEAQSVCDRVAIIDHGKIVSLDTPSGLIARHRDDPEVRRIARGDVTLEDVFIALTGTEYRD